MLNGWSAVSVRATFGFEYALGRQRAGIVQIGLWGPANLGDGRAVWRSATSEQPDTHQAPERPRQEPSSKGPSDWHGALEPRDTYGDPERGSVAGVTVHSMGRRPVGEIRQPVATDALAPNVPGMQIAGEACRGDGRQGHLLVPPAPCDQVAPGAVIDDGFRGCTLGLEGRPIDQAPVAACRRSVVGVSSA